MKNIFAIMMIVTLLPFIAMAGEVTRANLHENVTFYIGFNKSSVEADRAVGKALPKNASASETAHFAEGIYGKALSAGDRDFTLLFETRENLDFSKPGSVSLWAKPVNWPTVNTTKSEGRKGHKQIVYSGFFLTSYYKTGYVVLQRGTPHVVNKLDKMMLIFPMIQGLAAGGAVSIDWKLREWHNLVMTWDSITFRVYIDGVEVIRTVLQRKLSMAELAPTFEVCAPAGVIIDEFFIYETELSPKQIADYYHYVLQKNE